MAAVEIRPFADEHLDGAAVLLSERHTAHRRVEPLLPIVDDFRTPIEGEWDPEGAGGAVALSDGDVVGYLIGQRRDDAVGPHIWTHIAGLAVHEPELAHDLYAVAADRWVEEGVTRHFVFVPATRDLIDPWFPDPSGRRNPPADVAHRNAMARLDAEIRSGVGVVIKDTSDAALQKFDGIVFDWIYIDGDHRYEYVMRDLANYVPKVKAGGYIVCDDYHYPGTWDDGVTQAVDDFMTKGYCAKVFKRRSQFVMRKLKS